MKNGKFQPRRQAALLLLCVFLALVLLTGCDPYAGKHPCSYDAKWVCSDPKIVLEYTWGEEGLESLETMEYNGETLYIRVGYLSSLFDVFPADSYNYEDMLFRGKWSYRGDQLVFTIEEDNLFGGAYEELVFEREA